MNILEIKSIVEKFKGISLATLEVYLNNYMEENLKVGNKYHWFSFDKALDIHNIIRTNIQKGFEEFLSDNEIDYAIVKETFKIGVWDMTLVLNMDMISLWENIGRYSLEKKVRKNASCRNNSFTLLEIPKFSFFVENKNISIYDFIIMLLEEKRKKMIEHYNNEINDWTRNIGNNMREINKLKNLDIE